MTRIFLADDHAIVRSGLRLLLEREADLAVVGEAGDGRAAVDAIAREQVDVAVIDVTMPGLNGIDAASQIARKHPGVHIVMLSMHSDESYVLRCLRAGARAYVLKESAESELIAAIRAVMKGKSFVSPKARRILQQDHILRRRRTGRDDGELLTDREREVLQLIAEGHSNKEIAARLFLSVYTVETHRKNILEKLNVRGTADLILHAVRTGMIQ